MTNQAAWITAQGAPLKVDAAPYPKAGHGQLVVKNAAVAINPVDWYARDTGYLIAKYPFITGCDVAGEVVEVGPGVTRFQKGDRVISYAQSAINGDPTYGGFQHYTLAEGLVSSPIPRSLAFENAAVLPLAMSTAAAGLYGPDGLGLPFPTRGYVPCGKTLVVWGGASAVGTAVLQLGNASGLDVVATASARNHAYVRELGAKTAVDYKSGNLEDEVVAAVQKTGTEFVGLFDAVGKGGWEGVLSKLGGGTVVSTLETPRNLPAGVKATMIFAGTIVQKHQQIAQSLWRDFIPTMLENGKLKAKPDPIVMEGGLAQIQSALEKQKQGVSAAKVVVKL